MTLARRFMELFRGSERAYGSYMAAVGGKSGEKVAGRAVTVAGTVVEELWQRHLDGKSGIGIIPICADNTCRFGAIDIDVYAGLDHAALCAEIEKLKLPLRVCASKSGGAHLYLFVDAPVDAKIMREKLLVMATVLGRRGVEIFPKQDRLNNVVDVGNWINMPYFGSTRLGFTADGRQYENAEAFLNETEAIKITPAQLATFKIDLGDAFPDGPPCLRRLALTGIPEGARNNGLYNVGVYLKKAFPNDWQSRLGGMNGDLCKPPLPDAELKAIEKSLEKKDYRYKCAEPPISQYCDRNKCMTQRYGIIGGNGSLTFGTLTKVNSEHPVWLLNINGQDLEFSSDDILDQKKVRKACMDRLHVVPPTLKNEVWDALINEKLAAVVVVDMPPDSGPSGRFMGYLEDFAGTYATGRSREDLLLKKVFVNVDDGRTYFQMADLLEYLKKMRFFDLTHEQIANALRAIPGAKHEQLSIRKKRRSCWSLPSFERPDGDLDVPHVKEDF